jgi:DNA repair exonuclease SbcCD ATPase subunit
MNLVLKFKHEIFMTLSDYQAYIQENHLTMSIKESQAYKSILDGLQKIDDVLDLKEKVIEITLTLKKSWVKELFESEADNLLYKSLVVHLKDPQYSKTKLLHAQTKEIRKLTSKFPTEEFHRLQEENTALLEQVSVLQSKLSQMETELNQEREKNTLLASENSRLKKLEAEFYAHTPIHFVPKSDHEELKGKYQKLEETLSQIQTEKSELTQAQQALTEKATESEKIASELQVENEKLKEVHFDLFQQNIFFVKEIKDLQNKHHGDVVMQHGHPAPVQSRELPKGLKMF